MRHSYAHETSLLPSCTPVICEQEALKNIRDELAKSLADVETQLEELGGSASTVTARSMSQKSVKSTKSMRSTKAPSTVAEEDEEA